MPNMCEGHTMFAVEFWLANVSAMRITAENFRAIMSYFSAACKTDENRYHPGTSLANVIEKFRNRKN
jgi:hypothetical protein